MSTYIQLPLVEDEVLVVGISGRGHGGRRQGGRRVAGIWTCANLERVTLGPVGSLCNTRLAFRRELRVATSTNRQDY